MAKNGTAQCILVLVVLVVLQDLCSASLRNPSRLGACAQQCSWSCGLIFSGGQGNRSNGPNPNEIQMLQNAPNMFYLCQSHKNIIKVHRPNANIVAGKPIHMITLDDGWPESVEEQGLLLLVWRHNFTNNIWKMCYRQSRRGVARQNSEKCKPIACIANTFTHRRFYTQKLLHTEAFTHRSFYTETITHKAFTHRSFYIQMLLHTDVFTHRRFYTDTVTHRHVYTQTLLHTDLFTHRSYFYTQTLWHTEAFTHRRFYTQALLRTNTFTRKHFYTQTLLHADACAHRSFYTQTLLRRNTFTHRRFYTQMALHTSAFTHNHLYTQTLLHRGRPM